MIAMASMEALVKEGGLLLLAVPVAADSLVRATLTNFLMHQLPFLSLLLYKTAFSSAFSRFGIATGCMGAADSADC